MEKNGNFKSWPRSLFSLEKITRIFFILGEKIWNYSPKISLKKSWECSNLGGKKMRIKDSSSGKKMEIFLGFGREKKRPKFLKSKKKKNLNPTINSQSHKTPKGFGIFFFFFRIWREILRQKRENLGKIQKINSLIQ